jgi:hypothetical protein
MAFKHRTDAPQADIVNGLRDRGVSVRVTSSLGDGFPDLVCGYHGLTVLMEVKTPLPAFERGGAGGKRPRTPGADDDRIGLTPAERIFIDSWRGQPIAIVRSLAEALACFGLDEEGAQR